MPCRALLDRGTAVHLRCGTPVCRSGARNRHRRGCSCFAELRVSGVFSATRPTDQPDEATSPNQAPASIEARRNRFSPCWPGIGSCDDGQAFSGVTPDPTGSLRSCCRSESEGGVFAGRVSRTLKELPEAVLCRRRRWALRGRPAGGGSKPPQAASVTVAVLAAADFRCSRSYAIQRKSPGTFELIR